MDQSAKKNAVLVFSSHCGTSRDEKCAAQASLRTVSEQQVNSRLKTCAPPMVHRSDVSPRKKHISNNPLVFLGKLITGRWRTSLPHLRPRFVQKPFSLRGDVERLLTPFLQMWMFSVVPTCTLSMCTIQSRDGSKLSEMLIAPHAVLAPYLCGLLSASWKHKMCVMFAD